MKSIIGRILPFHGQSFTVGTLLFALASANAMANPLHDSSNQTSAHADYVQQQNLRIEVQKRPTIGLGQPSGDFSAQTGVYHPITKPIVPESNTVYQNPYQRLVQEQDQMFLAEQARLAKEAEQQAAQQAAQKATKQKKQATANNTNTTSKTTTPNAVGQLSDQNLTKTQVQSLKKSKAHYLGDPNSFCQYVGSQLSANQNFIDTPGYNDQSGRPLLFAAAKRIWNQQCADTPAQTNVQNHAHTDRKTDDKAIEQPTNLTKDAPKDTNTTAKNIPSTPPVALFSIPQSAAELAKKMMPTPENLKKSAQYLSDVASNLPQGNVTLLNAQDQKQVNQHTDKAMHKTKQLATEAATQVADTTQQVISQGSKKLGL